LLKNEENELQANDQSGAGCPDCPFHSSKHSGCEHQFYFLDLSGVTISLDLSGASDRYCHWLAPAQQSEKK
jgi:hypothetical protein